MCGCMLMNGWHSGNQNNLNLSPLMMQEKTFATKAQVTATMFEPALTHTSRILRIHGI